jgi:ABC-2 type transport system permease protein
VRREIVRIMRIWTQTLIPPAITMTLYFVIFGKLIGSRIGTIEGGFSYIQYIVPGLVMMSIITNSYGNISSSFFGAKFSRSVEEMLVSPMPNWVILLGYVTGAVARGLVVGALVLLIALLFTSLNVVHPIITFLSVLLGATIFSLAGFVNAVYREEVRRHRAGADLHADAADLSRRRVLFGEHAGRTVAGHLAGQPDPLHGQRVPLRRARHQRREYLASRSW